MKIAVAITTIHTPTSLPLLRKCSANARFFVSVDEKTPDEVRRFVDTIHGAKHYLTGDTDWKCSEAIGFSTMARRNIAFLEAIAWGADIIVAHDVDNYPLDLDYFWDFEQIFWDFHGVEVTGKDHWFDGGAYLRPPSKHRGFPIQHQHRPVYKPVTDRKVGMAAGLILNDPDVDSMTRIVQAPDSQQVSLIADAGMIVGLDTWTIFNTQNSAVIRELVPAWFLGPGLKRMDDIYASMIVQRVARERGLHVHFGKPFCLQQRHEHDLIKDMRDEIDGYSNVVKLAALLDSIIIAGKSVIEDTRTIYKVLEHCEWYPLQAVQAAFAYLDDCEGLGL